MSLVFERFVTEGLGDLAYLIGDTASGEAAVIDPQVDVQRYVEAARRHGVAISHVLQTHVHEDFVSGAGALALRSPGARVFASGEDHAPYGYDCRLVHDGDRFELGTVLLTARHTPGHTPEHLSFLVAESHRADTPYAVFSGGSLLVDAAGRTDLLGVQAAHKLADAQYETLHSFYARLPDHVIVHPTHAHGSSCGAAIGDRFSTTIGYEKRFNRFLVARERAAFMRLALENLPPKPVYYPRVKELNLRGTPVPLPAGIAALTPREFQAAAGDGHAVVDTRTMLAFGGGHVPGALNLGADPRLPVWAGWMLDPQQAILLVAADDGDVDDIVTAFGRTGFTRFAGYLAGGMSAWEQSGLPLESLPQVAVHALHERRDEYVPLDVRAPGEWAAGHVPGATHVFLPELPERIAALDETKRYAVYCDSGYRASIAASLLQRAGFGRVANVPGSWQAWTRAGLPVSA
ncbi:MAG: MBL fold metallo-hydrolase [Rudaea sp.]